MYNVRHAVHDEGNIFMRKYSPFVVYKECMFLSHLFLKNDIICKNGGKKIYT